MASAGAAGADPAAIAASIAVWKRRDRRHDVSIQTGALAGAAYRGMAPRAKTSMTIMRPPQQGHGRGKTRGPSGSAFSAAPSPLASAAGEYGEQRAGLGDVLRAPAIGEQPVMADAVSATA